MHGKGADVIAVSVREQYSFVTEGRDVQTGIEGDAQFG